MSLGQTDERALLLGQLAQAQQVITSLSGNITQRSTQTIQDARNGLAYLSSEARGGNADIQRALKDFFAVLDEARDASAAKIVLPPGAAKAKAAPVLIQAAAGELLDVDGAPAEGGNVLA